MDPQTRPAEWATALAAGVAAVLMYFTSHDFAVLIAALIGIMPVLITAVVQKAPALWRFRPTEVLTAVIGLTTAAVLFFAEGRDIAALNAAVLAFLPVIVTAFGTRPTLPPQPA